MIGQGERMLRAICDGAVWAALVLFLIALIASIWVGRGQELVAYEANEANDLTWRDFAGQTESGIRVEAQLAQIYEELESSFGASYVEHLAGEKTLGFAIDLHHTDHLEVYLEGIDEIAAEGFNSLLIVTPMWQTDGASREVWAEHTKGRGPSRGDLVAVIERAKMRGLKVALMPVVLFTHPRGNEWRGKLFPAGDLGWDKWWVSYGKTLDLYVDLAVETGVDSFGVGSELLSTERQTERWVNLIASVREKFSGRVFYSTNWDHYHVPKYWDRLDFIGVSAYYDLTGDGKRTDPFDPDPRVLAMSWKDQRDRLAGFGSAIGKPVIFTELGYPSLGWGVKDPWNYVNSSQAKADHQTQALGYEAFARVFADLPEKRMASANRDSVIARKDAIAGVFFYKWDVYYRGGRDDTGYGVRGKPSLEVLRKWLRGRNAAGK